MLYGCTGLFVLGLGCVVVLFCCFITVGIVGLLTCGLVGWVFGLVIVVWVCGLIQMLPF